MKRQKHNKKRVILGVTGSFGGGKTTVARMFKSSGAEVIDADALAHSVIRKGEQAYKKIIAVFGESILKKDKGIDRKKLAQRVFSNKWLLERLNRLIHPGVIRLIKKKIQASSKSLIVLDAPLLIEANLRHLVDKLVVIKISRKKQIERVGKKTGLERAQILERIKAQIPLKEKIRMADFIIDNSLSLKRTRQQVAEIRRKLWKS